MPYQRIDGVTGWDWVVDVFTTKAFRLRYFARRLAKHWGLKGKVAPGTFVFSLRGDPQAHSILDPQGSTEPADKEKWNPPPVNFLGFR